MSDLQAIRDDLGKVLEQATWAHALAYSRPGRGLDAERGAYHRPPTPEERVEQVRNRDHVGGARYDIGTGNVKARAAYQAAVRTVGVVDVHLAACLRAEGVAWQPSLIPLDWSASPSQLASVARQAQGRARQLEPYQGHHVRRLRHLRTLLDARVRAFSVVLDAGPAEGIAHAEGEQTGRGIRPEDRCRVCDTGKKLPKAGGRCSKCRAFYRKHGRENDEITPAKAKAKRVARGEDYGVA